MKALTALLVLAGTAGIGYLVYKKMNDKKEDIEAYTEYTEREEPHKTGGKVHRASMYAVGTIKTTADKISEGIKQVKSEDMVEKGEKTVEQIKESSAAIKERVKESADNVKEGLRSSKGNIKDNIKDTTGNIKDELKDTTDNIKDEIKDAAGNIKGEINEIKNLVASINGKSDETENEYDDIDEDLSVSDSIPEAESVNLDEDANLFEEIEIVDQL